MNQIFKGPQQMEVEVILASDHAVPDLAPLYTIRLRYPRIIHGEIMTHRVFSRNARSSRAVPVKTMLKEVRETPFVPWHWGANQKGMQASEECNQPLFLEVDGINFDDVSREEAWLLARDSAATTAEAFMDAGYHKQIPNRLLEPFSWIDTLITSNRWDNFLWLRDHEDAEPHLQDLAGLVCEAISAAKIQSLDLGDWHLPYITQEDLSAPSDFKDGPLQLRKISAARCARISYKPFNGDASYTAEIDRYNMLVSSDRVHASPLEHQAQPDTYNPGYSDWEYPELHGNLPGWIQFRKTIPNENYSGENFYPLLS